MKIEMNEHERSLFVNAGIDPTDTNLVLSTILASPMAIAQNTGVERCVRLAVKLASLLPPGDLGMLLDGFEPMPVYCTGALDPKDMPNG